MMTIIKNSKAFTLIELVLMITCLGFLSIALMPKDTGLAPLSLDAASRKVKADLRYIQSLSTFNNDNHGFRITGETTYEVYHVSTDTIINSPHTNTPMSEDLSTFFDGAIFSNQNIDVEFNNLGMPSSTATITLSNGTTTKQIQINAATGLIDFI